MTWACHNGSRSLTIPSRRSDSNVSYWDDTRLSISVSGIGITSARMFREMLLDSRSLARPYINRKSLEAVVRAHLKGDRNYTIVHHKVLTLELVHRLFIDNLEQDRRIGGPVELDLVES